MESLGYHKHTSGDLDAGSGDILRVAGSATANLTKALQVFYLYHHPECRSTSILSLLYW